MPSPCIRFRFKTQIFFSILKNNSVHKIAFSNRFHPSTRISIHDWKTITAHLSCKIIPPGTCVSWFHNLVGFSIFEYPETIHLQTKQDGVSFCLFYGRTFFLTNEATVPHKTKIATKCGNTLFENMYFFYFFAINALRMSSKYFVYKWWAGDKSTFCKIVLKFLNIYIYIYK